MPWEALLRDVPKSKDTWKDDFFSSLSFLIHDYAISYHSSASLATTQYNNQREYQKEIIGVFPNRFPSLDGMRFNPLPYSQKLAEEIPQIYSNSALYTNRTRKGKFKEILIQEHQTRFLHIDSHGLAHEYNPDSSAVLFSDSLLYLAEILDLDVSSFDLISLVTCSSGEGMYIPGEGIISIGRGFIIAGAKRIIHSLWLAGDESSAILFRYFYQFVSEGEEYSEALRLAKLRVISEPGGHPTFWVNFILFGKITNP